MMWAAVRWGALRKPNGSDGWLRDSWRVLLFTLIAAPFVIPPAIVISIALLLFLVFEFILWLPLKLAQMARIRLGKPVAKTDVKDVNLPRLGRRPRSTEGECQDTR